MAQPETEDMVLRAVIDERRRRRRKGWKTSANHPDQDAGRKAVDEFLIWHDKMIKERREMDWTSPVTAPFFRVWHYRPDQPPHKAVYENFATEEAAMEYGKGLIAKRLNVRVERYSPRVRSIGRAPA